MWFSSDRGRTSAGVRNQVYLLPRLTIHIFLAILKIAVTSLAILSDSSCNLLFGASITTNQAIITNPEPRNPVSS
jgi:hypothetical protein